MTNQRIARMMHKERHTRNGKVMLNILKYDVMFVVQHWGYLDRESACEFFKYVTSLLEDETKRTKSKKKKEDKTDEPSVTD